jgi:hypothetical protein
MTKNFNLVLFPCHVTEPWFYLRLLILMNHVAEDTVHLWALLNMVMNP